MGWPIFHIVHNRNGFQSSRIPQGLKMKVGYSLSEYKSLEETYNIDVGLSKNQMNILQNGECVQLTPNQLDHVATQLDVELFLREHLNSFSPVSMSLFVVNDTLWKMMKRKILDSDKMLAMTTMPYCYWDQREEKTSNPKGVKREKPLSNEIILSDNRLRIEGAGGDFEGFIDQRYLTARKFGIPEHHRLIPNYQFYNMIVVDLCLDRAKIEIHPPPNDMLDYDFSESARVFYEHGVLLSLPGGDVHLTVGKRPTAELKGDVHILLGKKIVPEANRLEALVIDLWLWLFQSWLG